MTLIEKGELLPLDTSLATRPSLAEIAVANALPKLTLQGEADLYRAADPGYPGNFSRDSILAAMIGGDMRALEAQVVYSARHIGKKTDAFTGEEPGKAHHELPAVEFNGASTAYNACDTTALLLMSIAKIHDAGNEALVDELRQEIDLGIAYIKRHVRDGLFYEDPKLAGAERFGLRVTYWKDSVLNTTSKEEPRYPVVYSLAHFQNADALAKMATVLQDMELEYFATSMIQAGIEKLWTGDHFATAIDADGVIDAPSTDSLYCLLHISPFLMPEDYAELIQEYSRQLETKAGYQVGLPVVEGRDEYHTRYVWTHEQALIHAAAKRYGLDHVQQVTKRVVGFYKPEQDIYPELIDPVSGNPAGNDLQLWSVRAYQYFLDDAKALL